MNHLTIIVTCCVVPYLYVNAVCHWLNKLLSIYDSRPAGSRICVTARVTTTAPYNSKKSASTYWGSKTTVECKLHRPLCTLMNQRIHLIICIGSNLVNNEFLRQTFWLHR